MAIAISYIAWFYNGTWTLVDDIDYSEQGYALLELGLTPFSILSPEGIDTLHSLSGSRHILYSWWTFSWMWLLGDHYYSPVVANVFITFISAYMFSHLLREIGFDRAYRDAITIFYLLHWDTVAWSSFLNLKDSIIQLLTISAFLFGLRCFRDKSLSSGVMLAIILLLFQYIRFYIPILMAIGLVAWLLFESRDPIKILFFLAIGFVTAMLGPWHYFQDTLNPLILFRNALRFSLTPQPWAVQSSYSFLYIPSLAHWIFFLPALLGAINLIGKNRFFRLLAWYVFVVILFYAASEDFLGVRQRVQISFVFTWAQIHFLWQWVHVPFSQNFIFDPAHVRDPRLSSAASPFPSLYRCKR